MSGGALVLACAATTRTGVAPALRASVQTEPSGFAYARRLVLERSGHQAAVAFMEIPPGRSAYPYH